MNQNATLEGGIELWRGGVNTWDCDEMGHMNVRFYAARAVEGLTTLLAEIGMPSAFAEGSSSTVTLREMHIRFMREALAGQPLHIIGGIVEIGEAEALILQLLIHSGSGEISAVIQSRITHTTARTLKPFRWGSGTRSLAEAFKVTVPAALAPRSLSLGRFEGTMTLDQARDLEMTRIGLGAIQQQETDVFGRMRAETILGRVSDGVAGMIAPIRTAVARSAPGQPQRVGGAVLENRLVFFRWPRAGDRFEIRSGVLGHDEKVSQLVHWLFDPATGAPWAVSEAVAITLDLDARKIVPISAEAGRSIQSLCKSGIVRLTA